MSEPANVVLMSQSLSAGGTERQLTEIARTLDRARFQPVVVCLEDGIRGDELRAAQVPVLVLPVRSFQSLEAVRQAWRLRRYLRQNKVQIAHAFDYPMACYGVPIAKWARVPVVLSSQRADRALNPALFQRLQRITDHLVDGVVVNCEAMRKHLREDEGVPERLIELCYNGVDTARFAPGFRKLEAGAALVIGNVGQLRPEKGQDVLLRAFAHLGNAADLRLLLVGGGEMHAKLKAAARELGIADRLRMQPPVSAVTPWLRKIDIFVQPSLSEALSNSLMEAMACGCAVVASDAGGNPELVRREETGLLFPAGNAEALAAQLRRMIQDADLRTRLATAAAQEMRARFSLQASVRRMEELYVAFINRKK